MRLKNGQYCIAIWMRSNLQEYIWCGNSICYSGTPSKARSYRGATASPFLGETLFILCIEITLYRSLSTSVLKVINDSLLECLAKSLPLPHSFARRRFWRPTIKDGKDRILDFYWKYKKCSELLDNKKYSQGELKKRLHIFCIEITLYVLFSTRKYWKWSMLFFQCLWLCPCPTGWPAKGFGGLINLK